MRVVLVIVAAVALSACAHPSDFRMSTDGQMTNTEAAAIAREMGKW